MKRGGRGGFKPWYSKGSFQQQKEKPLFSFTKNGRDDDEAGGGSLNTDPQNSSDISFSTDREPGSYVGWKLYFPFKSK